MAWYISCTDPECDEETWAAQIVDLIDNHRDESGWFLHGCGKPGYIEKSFSLQEGGNPWNPFLKGAIPLGDDGEVYQPFVFLVGNSPDGPADSIWFSYYKDLRSSGGRLKLGYGPGGPPVLTIESVRGLMGELTDLGCV